MTDVTTDVSINNAALLLAGDVGISALPGATRGGKVAHAIYKKRKNFLITSYPWRWAVGQVALNRLTAAPLFKQYKYAFQLPTDYVRMIRTEFDTPFEIYERLLYSNQESVNIEYEFTPTEDKWPDYFSVVVELKMASVLSLAVGEDRGKAGDFNELFKQELVIAKAIDAQSHPTKRLGLGAFTNVRR